MRVTVVSFWIALLVAGMLMVPAALAGPEGPLVERVEEKADEAGDDPVGFAQNHTSEEGLAEEARWTRDYTCFVAREAAKEAGQPPPQVPGCPVYEEVREDGLELDPDQADTEDLGFAPVAEARALVEDAVETVGEIVDDPGGALDAIRGFLQRTGQAVGRLVSGAWDFVTGLVGEVADGIVQVASVPRLVGEGMLDVAGVVGSGLGDAFTRAGTGLAETWGATTTGIKDAVDRAVDAVVETAGSVGGKVQQTFRSIFAGPGTDETIPAPGEPDGLPGEEKTDGLLRDVEDNLPGL